MRKNDWKQNNTQIFLGAHESVFIWFRFSRHSSFSVIWSTLGTIPQWRKVLQKANPPPAAHFKSLLHASCYWRKGVLAKSFILFQKILCEPRLMWITEKEQGRVIKNKGDEFCWKKLKHEKFIEAVRKWQMLLASKVKISGIEKTKANMNSRNKIFGKHIDNSANFFFLLIWKKVCCTCKFVFLAN